MRPQQIVDLTGMQVVGTIDPDAREYPLVGEFSKDNRLVSYYDRDTGYVGVWNVEARKDMYILKTGEDSTLDHEMTYPDIDSSNRYIAAGYWDDNHNFLFIWDFRTGGLIRKISTQLHINVVAFNPDSTRLFGGDEGGMIHVWDPRSGKEIQTYGGFADSIDLMHFIDPTHLQVTVRFQTAQILLT